MPKTVHPVVQSANTLFVISAQRFDEKKTMAYVGRCRKSSGGTGLTRAGYMIWVEGAALMFIMAAAREKNHNFFAINIPL